MMEKNRPMCAVGQVIRGEDKLVLRELANLVASLHFQPQQERWKVTSLLGAGGFGQVYAATDLDHPTIRVAIKTEPLSRNRQLIRTELAVLKQMEDEDCTVRFYGSGKTDTFCYMVMGLVGQNLSALRKAQSETKFSSYSVCEIAIQAIKAIRCLHDHGVLHRDIKPSNFAIGARSQDRKRIYILDFGLSRIYRTADGKVRQPRSFAGFRGTTRYASVNAHSNIELGRVDDLWSLLYMLIEILTGGLPWRRLKEKTEVQKMKQSHHNPVKLTSGCEKLSAIFTLMFEHLNGLTYADEPDYNALIIALSDCQSSLFLGSDPPPLDWMKKSPRRRRNISRKHDANAKPGHGNKIKRSTSGKVNQGTERQNMHKSITVHGTDPRLDEFLVSSHSMPDKKDTTGITGEHIASVVLSNHVKTGDPAKSHKVSEQAPHSNPGDTSLSVRLPVNMVPSHNAMARVVLASEIDTEVTTGSALKTLPDQFGKPSVGVRGKGDLALPSTPGVLDTGMLVHESRKEIYDVGLVDESFLDISNDNAEKIQNQESDSVYSGLSITSRLEAPSPAAGRFHYDPVALSDTPSLSPSSQSNPDKRVVGSRKPIRPDDSDSYASTSSRNNRSSARRTANFSQNSASTLTETSAKDSSSVARVVGMLIARPPSTTQTMVQKDHPRKQRLKPLPPTSHLTDFQRFDPRRQRLANKS